MPDKRIAFDLSFRSSPSTSPSKSGCLASDSLSVVVLGDFSGRANRGVIEPLDSRRLRKFDGDNLSDVFAQLGAKLHLELPGTPAIELAIASLDDFHPDRLVEKVGWLSDLTNAHRLLLNPFTAEKGRQELESVVGIGAPTPVPPPDFAAESESDKELFARLLGEAPRKQNSPAASGLDKIVQHIIGPHVVASPGPWQQGALAASEMEFGRRLNAVLHHPDFQSLEGAWRGVDMLSRRCSSGNALELLLIDVSSAELILDPSFQEGIGSTALLRLLSDRNPRLILGFYTFGQTFEDLQLLNRLGTLAAELSAPFIASAAPALFGCDSFETHPDFDDWKAVRPSEMDALWRKRHGNDRAKVIAG